jgi:TPR repeat protein
MSHRVYLYNTNEPDAYNEESVMMMEWGYELSILLHPLLFSDGRIIEDGSFDVHISLNPDEPEDSPVLFYHAETGIENFKRFYNFIEKHQDQLIDNAEKFQLAKERLFKYLDELDQPYFLLNASDVFNMSDEDHSDQAQEWIENIRYNNSVISNAIDADDISQLNLSLFTKHTGLGFKDFKALLNYEDYDYGWAMIDHPEPEDTEVFEENGLMGLKDGDGKTLIAPVYDKIYDFSYDDIAVVSSSGQFGYVNKSGLEIIKPQFDDAFDFEGGYASVVRAEQYGLIDKKGSVVIDFQYQDLIDILSDGRYFTAKSNNKWGVIDAKNTTLLPFEQEESISSDDYGSTFTIPVPDKTEKLIYTNRFAFLTKCDPNFVTGLSITGESYLYEITKNEKTTENLLYNDQAQLIMSGYEKIKENLYTVFILKKQKKQGLINYKGELLLDFDYDKIEKFQLVLNEPLQNLYPAIPEEMKDEYCTFFKIKKGKKCGVYLSVGNFNKQIIELIYNDIKPLDHTTIAVKQGNLWGVTDVFKKSIPPVSYDFIISTHGSEDSCYACKGDHVYLIDSGIITDADPKNLQYYINLNKETGYYYFDVNQATQIQVYIDKSLAPEDLLYNKATALLESGRKTDTAKAVKLFQEAITLGHIISMNELAVIYEDHANKYPEHKNPQESFQLFLRAAQAGNTIAMYNTGLCYSKGMGIPADTVQMIHWYTQAFDAGYTAAALKLGNYYYNADEDNEDYEQALKYYTIAEKEGENLNIELAWLHNHFNETASALPYLLKAAADEESYAYWQLGTYAQDGIEMEVNIPLAIERYKKAVEKGYNLAYLELYNVYVSVPGFEDKVLAAVYKEKAKACGLEVTEQKETFLDKFINIIKGKK